MTLTNHESIKPSQFQAAIDSLSEGLALFDSNDELVFCNLAFRHLFPDVSNYIQTGVNWSVFLHEALRRPGNAALRELDAHLESGYESVLVLPATSQGERLVQMSVHPQSDGGFSLTSKDVAEQHKAHDIIEHADDLLKDVLDACASRISVSSIADGEILYATPAWRSSFGQPEHIQAIFSDSLEYADLLTELLAVESLDDQTAELRRENNGAMPARLSARVIDYQDEPSIVISAEDMSQIYQQRDEILKINQRLLDAIEALDQGFALFDKEHNLVLANHHYLRVNHPIADILKPGVSNKDIIDRAKSFDHEPKAAAWESIGDGNEQTEEFMLEDQRVFSVNRRKTSDQGFVVAWTDITSKRQTEQELQKQRESAFQSEKLNALGQLLAGVAHELNNPLSVVVGHAMMLRDEVDNPEALDGVERISRAAQRCSKIVKTFLAMARQKPTRLAETSINDVVSNAMEIAAYGLRQRNVKIDLNLGQSLPVVLADEDQLTQVIINLMLNAEQAFESDHATPTLCINTAYQPKENQVVVRVSDNGPGIPEKLKVRIFEPFFTTKAVNEGTGVGLALSHRIASSHNGDLSLGDSELGGATFELTLPAESASEVIVNEVERQHSKLINRALVIEDEPEVAHVIGRLLKKFDIESSVAENAEAGLKILESDALFDLILCDLRMPGLGGRGFSERLHEQWPELSARFVFITGDAISEDADLIRQAAKYPILEKPVSPDELRSVIEAIANDKYVPATARVNQ
ncbi:MAG: PAS-domain containing protein [Gammaproteobacteria bacterium]|nr:PAS-domain containing protein [Gammaproteobacteria bacterium]